MRSASQIIYPSAARTAIPVALNSEEEIGGSDWEQLTVIVNVTVDPASASIACLIDGYDAASATWVNLLTSAAITGVGTTIMQIGPRVTTAANVARNIPIPPRCRVRMTVVDTDSMTYSVGAWLR